MSRNRVYEDTCSTSQAILSLLPLWCIKTELRLKHVPFLLFMTYRL